MRYSYRWLDRAIFCLRPESTRRPRLAMLLVAASETSSELGERRDALAELGWVDGRTIEIVVRYADGDFVLVFLRSLKSFLALDPDLILTHTAVAARAVARATRTIPVVIAAAGEELLVELVGNLARPLRAM